MEARTLLQNVSLLTVGKLGGEAFLFAAIVVLSRLFGEEAIGEYSFAIAYSGFFAVFADFGFYTYTVKEIGRSPESARDRLDAIFTLRIALSVLVYVAYLVTLPLLGLDEGASRIAVLIGAYNVLHRLEIGCAAVFIAHERMEYAAPLEGGMFALVAISSILVALATHDLMLSVAAFPLLAGGMLVLAYTLVGRHYGTPLPRVSLSTLTRTYREAVPYGLSLLVYQISSRTDVVLLGLLVGAAATGAYNIAFRSIALMLALPRFLGVALLPELARLQRGDLDELRELYRSSVRWIVLLGVPAAFGVSLIAAPAVQLLFGGGFAQSALILRLLSGLLLVTSLNLVLAAFLVAIDRQTYRTQMQWVTAGVSVGLNVLLIPRLGAPGAAIAVVTSELLLCALLAAGLRPTLGHSRAASRLAIAAIASAAFFIPLNAVWDLSPLLAVPAAMAIYCGVVLCFKDVRRNEFQRLVALLRPAA